jgi:hypothetical protein
VAHHVETARARRPHAVGRSALNRLVTKGRTLDRDRDRIGKYGGGGLLVTVATCPHSHLSCLPGCLRNLLNLFLVLNNHHELQIRDNEGRLFLHHVASIKNQEFDMTANNEDEDDEMADDIGESESLLFGRLRLLLECKTKVARTWDNMQWWFTRRGSEIIIVPSLARCISSVTVRQQ